MLWRIASTADTLVALFEGIHAEISTVISAITAAITTDSHDTQSRRGICSLPTMELNLSPSRRSVIPMPPIPTRIPSGIPMALTVNASNVTILLSCFLVAPTDESRPNCFVLSDTEMENAL